MKAVKKMLTTSLPRLEASQQRQRACILLADAHYRDKLVKQAADTLNDCLGKKIESVGIYNNLAQYEVKQKDVEAAANHLQTAVAKFPNVADAHYNLGVLQEKMGKKTEAESILREALEARRRVLGIDHPKTQQTSDKLASIRQE